MANNSKLLNKLLNVPGMDQDQAAKFAQTGVAALKNNQSGGKENPIVDNNEEFMEGEVESSDYYDSGDPKTYWANYEDEDLCHVLYEKMNKYYTLIRSRSQKLNHWRANYLQYYSNVMAEGLYKSGAQFQYTNLNVNQFSSLLDTVATFILQQPPAFEVQASNSDSSYENQTILARTLLEDALRTKNLSNLFETAVKQALLYGESFVCGEWDETKGDTIDAKQTANGIWTPSKTGDIKFYTLDPAHVIRGVEKTNAHSNDWYILRTYESRYNLMAQYPELADQIWALTPAAADIYKDVRISTNFNYATDFDGDELSVYYFYHKKTPACPEGRFFKCLNDEIPLGKAGPLPYYDVPVYRIACKNHDGTPFGCSVADELRPIQYQINTLYGILCSVQSALGMPNILRPLQSNVLPPQIQGAMRIIDYDANLGKPEVLDLSQLNNQIFEAINLLEKKMQELSAVNSVARGDPEPSLKSGAALALLQANAISQNSPLQNSYAQLLTHVGTGIIHMYKRFAEYKRTIAIVGKSNQRFMKDFTNQDLNSVDSVLVDMGTPLTNTIAGKEQLAEIWSQNKFIKNPNEYIEVVTTGRLDQAIEPILFELQYIRAENEMILNGQTPQAKISDDHQQHMLEHSTTVMDPNCPPEVLAASDAHKRQHEALWKQVTEQDPVWLAVKGFQPYPGAGAAAPAQGAPAPQGPQPQKPPQLTAPSLANAPMNPNGGQPQLNIPPQLHALAAQHRANMSSGNGVRQPSNHAFKQKGKATEVLSPTNAGSKMPNLPSGPRNPMTGVKMNLPTGAGRNTELSGKGKPKHK